MTIVKDDQNAVWIGTTDRGLDKIQLNGNGDIINIENYSSREGDASDLEANMINHLFIDSKQHLWVGTSGSGLYHTNLDDLNFSQLGIDQGLPGDVIYGILEDDDENLWFSTNNGMGIIDSRHEFVKSYQISDGLQHREFTVGACLKKSDGSIIFGGINGLNYFNGSPTLRNETEQALYVTALGGRRYGGVRIGPKINDLQDAGRYDQVKGLSKRSEI